LQSAHPTAVRAAVRWWADHDEAWESLTGGRWEEMNEGPP
jgi:hypothetical protein